MMSSKLRIALKATHVDDDIIMRVVRTVVDMLRDRGCDEVVAPQTVEEVEATALAEESVIVGGPSPAVRVVFVGDDRVSVKTMRSVMESNAHDRTIFVSFDGPTAFAKREAVQAWGTSVQFFRYRELVYNVTKHALVPKHEKDEGDHPDASFYPHILVTDPVCQYHDFQVGDVVRISRFRGSVRPFSYFRTVVS